MLAQQATQNVNLMDVIVVLAYLLVVGYLGWLGYRRTKTATDYLLAGRKTHPFIMAMSYGATFISTSAIVGFGGVAGLFGMSLLWLTFCNIFVGIFIAFVLLGGPTRHMGHRLDAHTFPELLGRRYQSKFIQVFSGLLIFLFIPLYASAVLIGGSEFITAKFGIDFKVALMLFSVIVAAYVIAGGLKGVMYTDALQGAIMFVGMVILLIFTYMSVGGVTQGHQTLTDLKDLVPPKLAAIGHQGWTQTPVFGFGELKNDLWWIVFSTIVLGVGIGVLAQPQLVVRFMTVKSKRELNRAVVTGGIFILAMTGIAFTVGALSNAYFAQHGMPFTGKIVKTIDAEKGHAVLGLMKKNDAGAWEESKDAEGKIKVVPVVLVDKTTPVAQTGEGDKKVALFQGRSISIVYAGGNDGQIIPAYITTAMPPWFALIFLLVLLAAAMSTLSSQFHTTGTAIGRDVYETLTRRHGQGTTITRIGTLAGIIVAVTVSYYAGQQSTFIARATAIFFGLCASTFLPSFIGGLFSKRVTRPAAIASMLTGAVVTVFWLSFVKAKEAETIGLVQSFVPKGKFSILWNYPNWPSVDPLVVALPISTLVLIVVSLITRKPGDAHLSKCFQGHVAPPQA